MPLYPLYALLFADAGLSVAEISALFAIWSVVGIVAEVPSGVWADRYSRRAALVLAGLFQAAGYVVWIALPGFAGFAAGFVLWGIGGSLASGSFEALVYDGLEAAGAADRYAWVVGRAQAAALAVQVPLAAAATGLFALGGYQLAGWVSVGICLSAAALASRLSDVRPANGREGAGEDGRGYLSTLRAGLAEAGRSRPVRMAILAVALVTGFEGLEEYYPLLAADWGVPVAGVPLALAAFWLVAALGAILGERGLRLGPFGLGALMLGGTLALAAAAIAATPASIVGLVVFYGSSQVILVVAGARLQARIDGPARATITSVAGLASELTVIVLIGAWAVGGLGLIVGLAVAAAMVVPRWLGTVADGATVGRPEPRSPLEGEVESPAS